ncbi:hypothetical protein [Sphingobium sp. MK2]|uniref:hypothetical protein n=1 Tax=Sphingobium sp. MK2 TaxID=3116540 RepID=UPI0032E361E4
MNKGQLPLSAMRPVDIRTLNEPGLIFPIEKNAPCVAVTLWKEIPTAIVLDGPHAFTFFKIENHSRATGLFVPAPEIVVKVGSAVRGESAWDKRGTLILENGCAHVIGSMAGSSWSDPVNIPLWQQVETEQASGKVVGFSGWSLRIPDGLSSHTIWEFAEPES